MEESDVKEVAAGVVLFRMFADDQPRFLLMQASYPPYHWSAPKGHVEAGESLKEAAFREVEEESGFQHNNDYKIYDDFKVTLRYVANGNPKKSVYFLGKMNDSAESLSTHDYKVKISNEHQKFDWVSLEKGIELVQHKNSQNLLEEANECIIFKKSAGLL